MIVADIGATNARFAVARPDGTLGDARTLKGDDFARFELALDFYLKTLTTPPREIAIGAAGPLRDGGITLTNRYWSIDPASITSRFGIRVRALANDLVAFAAGVSVAAPEAFEPLHEGRGSKTGRTLVIAIGTGVGAAWYERSEGRTLLHPTEAGHVNFAPASVDDLNIIRRAFEHDMAPTTEDVASGRGIPRIYAMLKGAPVPETEVVLSAAESGNDAEASATVAAALSAIATLARNLTYMLAGADEIVLGGGLGLRLRGRLKTRAFVEAVRAPSALSFFADMSLKLATDAGIALKGIAALAHGDVQCADIHRDAA